MSPGPLLFLATFFIMATSWLGFVLGPQLQIGRQPQVMVEETGAAYPPMRPGMARQGEQVYRANGCFYCHTQQVRPRGYGGDVEHGWGGRPGIEQSVNEDYLYDQPAMLGTQRVGPDLANIGKRQPDATTLLMHLYDPRLTVTNSVMPPYRFLFEKRPLKIGQKPSAEALSLGGDVPPGYQIVPTADGRALAAYLQSLRSDVVLYETPGPTNVPPAAASTNAAPGATNAPAGTNAPATNSATTNAPVK